MGAWWLVAAIVLLPDAAMACKCATDGSVCTSIESDTVFIGTVESIEPAMNPWDPAVASRLEKLIPESLLADKTTAGIARLKRIYLQALPNLPTRFKRELESVTTAAEFDAFWDRVTEEGMRARFRIVETFRGSVRGIADVWTEFTSCGIPFQKGETYLVYASASKKKGGRLETSVCARTARVTDAGEDLTYLYFYRKGGSASSRLYGFVTTSEESSRAARAESVVQPAPGRIVKVASSQTSRFDTTDAKGRFVLDGLEEGSYRVSVYDSLGDELPVTAPVTVQVAANSCTNRVLVVPQRVDPPK